VRRPIPAGRCDDLLADARGLGEAEVTLRRSTFGPNDIAEAPPSALLDLLRDTARDPMIWLLAGTSGLYAWLGQRAEALTLGVASIPLLGMDAWLHRRTRASTEGLASRLAQQATVLRDGARRRVPALEVVPGDLVEVATGESFAADGVLIAGAELQVDESALSGEAHPVRKQPLAELPRAGAEPAVEAVHWGLAGTRLLTGSATLRVVYTGRETLYGEIVRSARGGVGARTPLQSALARLMSILIGGAAALCAVLAIVRVAQGYGPVDALVSAATLAVAALPEEFPVVFSFYLGVGVYRLAKRQALVRRAVSVENIGRISCICSDKTGTITEGRLRLAHLEPRPGLAELELLALAAVASRAESGDPLDAAIAAEAAARGAASAAASFAPLAVFPFTESRRCETAIVRDAGGARRAVTKGSAETLLLRCALGADEQAAWRARVDALAAGAHKVLGCATRPLAEGEPDDAEPREGYRFEGLLACEDRVREGVAEAVADCRDAGIHTIVVTGDHPLTARAVALEVGLGGADPKIVSGEDLTAFLSAPAADLRSLDVIARALPAQKLALVEALRERGEIVAVTGDGVNDVPALHAADVGIAMGERATRSAREVAAIVLLDDNFRTIVRAIREGRQLYQNLRLSFQYLILVHIPLVVTAALVPLAGFPLLYLPVHVVWLELLIHPTALLAFQDVRESGRLARRRNRARARFFSRAEWGWILGVAATTTALVSGSYFRGLGPDGTAVDHARALALATLVLASGAATAVLSRLRSRAACVIPTAATLLSVALLQIPSLAHRVHVEPLHAVDFAWILAAVGAGVALPLELGVRAATRRRRARRAGATGPPAPPRRRRAATGWHRPGP
jgi:Ca2+-transporting ATPase